MNKSANLIIVILICALCAIGFAYHQESKQAEIYQQIAADLSHIKAMSVKNDSIFNNKLDSLHLTASELSNRLVTIQKSNEIIRKRNAQQAHMVDSLFGLLAGRPEF